MREYIMETNFTVYGDRLRVSAYPSIASQALDYDLLDFRSEFRALAIGKDSYLIDARLQLFLDHYFGTSF